MDYALAKYFVLGYILIFLLPFKGPCRWHSEMDFSQIFSKRAFPVPNELSIADLKSGKVLLTTVEA